MAIWLCSLGAACFSAGCGGELNPHVKKMLMDCYASYNRGDDTEAIGLCDEFLRDHRQSERGAEALLIRGLSRYRQGESESAESDMRNVLVETNHPALQANATFILAEIALTGGDDERAEGLYSDCLKIAARDSDAAKQSHYRLGVLLQRRGNFLPADIQFEHLRLRFAGSELSDRAGRLVGAKAWTVQVGLFETPIGADARIATLAGSGIIARRQAILYKKKLTYAVWAGRENRFALAEVMLAKIKPLFPEAIITVDRMMEL